MQKYDQFSEMRIYLRQEYFADVLKMFYENIDKNQHPIGFYESIRNQFGDLKDRSTYENTQTTYLALRCCLMTAVELYQQARCSDPAE
jgi:hypothetical protein